MVQPLDDPIARVAPAAAAEAAEDAGDAALPFDDLETLQPPENFINREMSWLEFNERVLAEAFDARNPLLERVKFLAICANNLDEFYMVRVSGLQQQVDAGINTPSPDGLTPKDQLEAIDSRSRRMHADMARCWVEVLEPALGDAGLAVRDWDELDDAALDHLSAHFREQIFPVLTPLAVDPSHPFPYISNLSLNLAVVIRDPGEDAERFARVKVPRNVGRFVRVRPDSTETVPVEQVCAAHLGMLFPGMDILECHPFRVTRDSDLDLEDEDAEDLLHEIETGLRSRRFRSVVRIEIAPSMPERIRDLLRRELEVDAREMIEVAGILGPADMFDLATAEQPELSLRKWSPRTPPVLDGGDEDVDFFKLLGERDVLVHHPYESFSASVEEFIHQAVEDPDVLAIKQTLYRTTENSKIMASLIRAAESGKQVVVVVEIKARFDEERNIQWARRLEASGAHVAYGLVGLKTHSKAVLVVRQERDGIRRYVHLGTGNYNASTAGLYEDLGLFSTRPEYGADLTDLFNFLTGYSRQREFRTLLVAPYSLRRGLMERIERERDAALSGAQGRIRIKVNSVVDPELIAALYQASQAGVEIDLIVRGICCLRPGVPGVSDRIRVRSILGRFLEHSRIYHFHNGGDDEYWLGSADMMQRNLDRRVETLFPILDPALREEMSTLLDLNLADNRQAWTLHADGTWTRVAAPADADDEVSLHLSLMDRAWKRSLS
ncbi:MAG: polyphosphate kinase 1 [Acidimicrobiia bacterium]|nr:polyphosphate kinase 1 [Acidimicrobiia bacterium]